MEKTDWIKEIVKVPLEKLALILGCAFFLLAFNPVSYDKGWVFKLNVQPNWWLLGLGIVLITIPLYRIVKTRIPGSPRVKQITNGLRIKLSADHIIDVVVGEIQEISVDTSHGAVVLPANTSFDDECIRDPRSALGAFFQKHFPSGIENVQQLIQEKLQRLSTSNTCGVSEYSPGTTILLEKPLGSEHRVLITAVTRFSPKDGIHADTQSLAASVKSVFKASAGHRLSELFMPVIGTGHGGLDFGTGLALVLLHSIHCIRHEGTHHIKHLTVVVFDPNSHKRKQMENVVRLVSTIL